MTFPTNKEPSKQSLSLSLPQTQNSTTMPQPRFTSIITTFFFLLLLLLLLHTNHPICNALSSADLNSLSNHSEIGVMELDFMDSESNRRILAMQKKYISYETLKRDMVPCDRAGVSYYNCQARQANHYNRGCEVITACARGVSGIKT